MIRRCLIIDVETTGLNPAVDRVIEIGAVLYSVTNRTTLVQFSVLVANDENPAEKVNRIPVSALREVRELDDSPAPLQSTLTTLRSLADVIVAHNAEFDRSFFRGKWLELPWLCSAFDFTWPAASRDVSGLIHLALEHGIGVSSAHRALSDCQLIAALFDRMALYGCDLQEMFAHAMRPKALFQSLQPFDHNEVAKAAGFKWDGTSKRWTRRMAIDDAATLPFKTIQLQEIA